MFLPCLIQRSRIEDHHRLTHETQYLSLWIIGSAEVEATTRPDPAASFSKSTWLPLPDPGSRVLLRGSLTYSCLNIPTLQ